MFRIDALHIKTYKMLIMDTLASTKKGGGEGGGVTKE
jgi:hypothetical protein